MSCKISGILVVLLRISYVSPHFINMALKVGNRRLQGGLYAFGGFV